MIDRRQLQEDVKARLAPIKGPRQLEVFPDSAREFVEKHLMSPAGAILISYAGMRRVAKGENARPRELALDVVVISRQLNGDAGALATLAAIEERLDGWRITTGPRRLLVSYGGDRFVEQVNDVWQYVARVTITEA